MRNKKGNEKMKEQKNKPINIVGNGWAIIDGEFIETRKAKGDKHDN